VVHGFYFNEMIAALLFLLAASSRVELINEDFVIPANDRWAVGDPIKRPAWVECDFRSQPGARVRVVLLTSEAWHAWLAGQTHDEIAATAVESQGRLSQYVREPETSIVIHNLGDRPAKVHLRVLLEQPQVRYLSRSRQLTVIVISFGVFFAIVSLSARKLLKAIRK
jgi:hypothetical protein